MFEHKGTGGIRHFGQSVLPFAKLARRVKVPRGGFKPVPGWARLSPFPLIPDPQITTWPLLKPLFLGLARPGPQAFGRRDIGNSRR